MTIWGYKIGLKIIAMIGAVILVLLAVTLGPAACERMRSQGDQIRVDSAQMNATRVSGGDATNTVANSAQAAEQSEALTRSNEREIRNAPGANASVDPAARDAGLRALCRRESYRHTQRCRVFDPHP